MGDMIMATPLLRALAQRHGQPCDILGRGGWLPKLFAHAPFVGTVRCIDSLRMHYFIERSKWQAVAWMRARGVGPVYLLQTDPSTLDMVRRAGLTITADDDRCALVPTQHTIEHHRCIAGFGDGYDMGTELAVSESELTECRDWIGRLGCAGSPLVLIQAGNRKTSCWRTSPSDHKIWPPERWAEVARGVLAALPPARVLFIGSPNEQKLAVTVCTAVGDGRAIPVADQLPLRRLLALLRLAHSLISVDTGPAHAAAAMHCPAVVLFGRTDPRVTGPRSSASPVLAVGPPGAPPLDGNLPWLRDGSLNGIEAAQVLERWRELLMPTPGRLT